MDKSLSQWRKLCDAIRLCTGWGDESWTAVFRPAAAAIIGPWAAKMSQSDWLRSQQWFKYSGGGLDEHQSPWITPAANLSLKSSARASTTAIFAANWGSVGAWFSRSKSCRITVRTSRHSREAEVSKLSGLSPPSPGSGELSPQIRKGALGSWQGFIRWTPRPWGTL